MLQRVTIDGIELPRLYIAENKMDADLAKSKGIPYVRWTQGQEALIKILLRPVLEKMFPHIDWNKVLGQRRKFKTEVVIVEGTEEDEVVEVDMPEEEGHDVEELDDIHVDEDGVLTETADVAESERVFDGSHGETHERHLSIEEYVGDMSSYVNLDILQRLQLMPAFIGDILDCVRLNMSSNTRWTEGYNKRLGLAVGRYNASKQLPNLIILDVSASIPRGISATMISLIDTLRTQLSADLIITGATSGFYPMGATLPTPQRIRDQYGLGNESYMFFEILTNHIRGKHYGHVFSFGDCDTPYYGAKDEYDLTGTSVEHVHHYHTVYHDDTGYAKWCNMLSKKPMVEHNNEWCDFICTRW